MVLLLLIAVALTGIAVALAIRALAQSRKGEMLSHLAAYGFAGGGVPVASTGGRVGSHEDILTRIGTWFSRRLGAQREREIRQLLNSGGYYRTTVARYMAYRFLAVVGLPLLILFLASLWGSVSVIPLVLACAAGAFGLILPKTIVERSARDRTAKIDYEVPELVDLLVTTIEAGIGFGSSLQLCARRVRDPLGQELRLTLQEQAMGLGMNDALENMLARTARSVSMRAFVQAIVQGETLGVSIGKTLRDLAVDMRKRRRQVAEERAQKAPVKLLFPLTFLILPAMLIVILGPAVRAISHGLLGG
jgi:tight adherence protein C